MFPLLPLWIVFLACALTLWLGIGWLIHSMFEADKLAGRRLEEIENV